MALNIAVNENYRITSDTHNIIVNKRKIVDPTKSPNWPKRKAEGASPEPRETWDEVAYRPTIEQAMDKIVNLSILDSDATTFTDLRNEIRQLRREISEVMAD